MVKLQPNHDFKHHYGHKVKHSLINMLFVIQYFTPIYLRLSRLDLNAEGIKPFSKCSTAFPTCMTKCLSIIKWSLFFFNLSIYFINVFPHIYNIMAPADSSSKLWMLITSTVSMLNVHHHNFKHLLKNCVC